MSESAQLAAAAGSRDPAVGLRAVRALRDLADRLEELQVGNARVKGWSWQEIATCLGVSRQAVHKKYARRGFGGEEG
ncbi:RNA polymerase subunit sigma-70 [Kitasatospora sp. NPDC002227]|uniref:RNA polymerase subunit sigma-70 n=1 Tax=Kitasatospora sp. NPDC002227 TaxID=3154773 RepID=UPI00332BD3FD